MLVPNFDDKVPRAEQFAFHMNVVHREAGLMGRNERRTHESVRIGWTPIAPPAWALVADQHRFVGLDASGSLYLTDLQRRSHQTVATACAEGFRAVAMPSVDRLVAVTAADRLVWLRATEGGLSEWVPTEPIPRPGRGEPVAAFAARRTGEVLVLFADGFVVRVPAPE